ncbi:uncharacterized protein LOC135376053 [Ornithodoros turicata]|uniref:uncharacterized protein LOC135376053 n=1 Tax=Ornithodoros turicata TaxID=34597 RepID=UPI00313A3D64
MFDDRFRCLLRKGVYPYTFVDSFEAYVLPALPPKEAFKNDLNDEDISDQDYQYARDISEYFECSNFGDYTRLYVTLDTCQLYDVVLYAWSSVLKLTKVKPELVSDREMYETIEKGIRGGICGFEWVDPSSWGDIDFLRIPHDSEVGYVYVVDLSYPEKQHALTRDFPLAPEHRTVDEGQLSTYQRNLKEALALNAPPTRKLLLTCYDKESYVVHYYLLTLYVRLGMKIKHIHAILKPSIKPSIKHVPPRQFFVRLRASTTKFERLLYKTITNSTFGKTIQNVRRMKRYTIAYDKESALRKASSIDFQHFHILSDKCILYEMKQRRIKCTHPLYVGFAILEISKVRMYSFIYESLFSRLTCSVQLIYGDTDSIIFALTCESLVEQLMKIQHELDLSSYPPDHPLFNAEHANQMGTVSQRQCTIQSIKQTMYTISRVKKSLVSYDDKRYLVDAVRSFPYGTCEYEAPENPEESPGAQS